jgi:hypothetical protein
MMYHSVQYMRYKSQATAMGHGLDGQHIVGHEGIFAFTQWPFRCCQSPQI